VEALSGYASVIGVEHSEVGEVAIAFLLVFPALFLDRMLGKTSLVMD
jgi:hypothetical protein